MTTSKQEIGERIKTALTLTGKKQGDLAKETKIAVSTISAFVNGDRYPNPEKLEKLSGALNVTLDWLITGKAPRAETLLSYLPADEIEKLRKVLVNQPTAEPAVRESPGSLPASGVDLFILDAIKAADSETVGAVMNLLMKSKSKPEGSMKNGTEG